MQANSAAYLGSSTGSDASAPTTTLGRHLLQAMPCLFQVSPWKAHPFSLKYQASWDFLTFFLADCLRFFVQSSCILWCCQLQYLGPEWVVNGFKCLFLKLSVCSFQQGTNSASYSSKSMASGDAMAPTAGRHLLVSVRITPHKPFLSIMYVLLQGV